MSLRFESRSDGRSGQGGRGSGSFVIWTAVAIAVILAWTVGAFVLGGGSSGSNAGSTSASEKVKESDAGRDDYVAEDNVPVSNPPEEGGRIYTASEGAESDEPPENVGEDGHDDTHLPEGGASHEPDGHDPLDLSGQETPLLPADKDRARASAAQFVAAAYGYTGGPGEEDALEYIAGFSDYALTPEIYASPGAEEVKRYEELVRMSGTKSAAVLDLFEIREIIPEKRNAEGYTQQRVVGYAYFRTADEYDRYGDIEGDEKSYRQELTLERYRAVFKVYAVGEIEEVRE